MSNTKIGIDARLINETGVGVYIRNLLNNLGRLPTSDIEFYVYVKSHNDFNSQISNFKSHIANFQWHSFSEQIGFLHQLYRDDLDLMHFTYFSYPLLYRRPFIITIHDLTPLLFATGKASTHNKIIYSIKRLAAQALIKNAFHASEIIITPTTSVKNLITESYGKDGAHKISVTHEGLNEELLSIKENRKLSKRFDKPFFMYVGNFYPHKNIENLIRAFAKTKIKAQLILIGPNDYFAARSLQLINQLKQTRRIVLYSNPKLEDLVFFYKHAQALLHPSLAEGFGLPLLEASYFKCPIIASDIAIFHEVLENNYLAFNPHSIEDIAHKIEYFFTHKNNSTSLYLPQKTIENKFSFQKMAQETLKIYREEAHHTRGV